MSAGASLKGALHIGKTAQESRPEWSVSPGAPKGAPDIVFIVLDDVGFSDIGCYGSELRTPHIDSLAQGGLRYSNFHVTAMCSPTRACLLTGRNAHSVGVGIISEFANGYPAYEGTICKEAATLPEILRENGYNTTAIGKWHLTQVSAYVGAGPFDNWPLGRGFNRWYGFHGALTDQFHPELYRDNQAVDLTPRAQYHLSQDLVDESIRAIREHVNGAPDRPYFQYLAFGACHWPHQVPREYLDRVRGAYDIGWDAIRQARLERQKKLGIVPPDTELAPLNPGVSAWADLPEDVRRVCARLQEAYGAFIEHTDAQIGRVIDELRRLGRLDDTLIVFLSDNGASSEGGATGAFNARKNGTYERELAGKTLERLDLVGSEFSFNHYPTGWAQASNTPLKWYKKNTHGGGIRAPLILHWPRRIAAGEIRHQFHHVTDLVPTVLDIVGVEAPNLYRGTPQMPVHGTSMVYTFDEALSPTRKRTQYFELLGDRAVWKDGWKAVSHHTKGVPQERDVWELYRLDDDFSETRDLADRHPDKLAALVAAWWEEASSYGVLPLDDRDWERTAERLAQFPVRRFVLYPQTGRLDRLCCPDITDRSYRITAEVEIAADTEGVLLSWGSRFGGMVLYIRQQRAVYEYVYSDSESHLLESDVLPIGRVTVAIDFRRSGERQGTVSLSVRDTVVASMALASTWPMHGLTAGMLIGRESGASLSQRYKAPFSYNGEVLRVLIELEDDAKDANHGSGAKLKTVLREQ